MEKSYKKLDHFRLPYTLRVYLLSLQIFSIVSQKTIEYGRRKLLVTGLSTVASISMFCYPQSGSIH
ncbi:hypothetical protein ROZALSC1DRAFT_27104 [Rozella allomycis CSF55]|uniref:Uncharacterized protein n=1 Tax=Rozella allomycis (strain CSF55) TaxID=988480 RepID=A0A075AWI9_ROZAC|nr:hypothetical protein O9G_002749 [Rozella allomycis CSF55]RKP21488.1 hypothetical protein ROZALSC1DRAFT_27104 [Rozella allomycis CSF55]|eukprot:EPZ34685.1 hypothetical protein O9G_002749 [Rozella allomycis CSF55]